MRGCGEDGSSSPGCDAEELDSVRSKEVLPRPLDRLALARRVERGGAAALAVAMLWLLVASPVVATSVRLSGRLAAGDDQPLAGVEVSLRADVSPLERSLAVFEGRPSAPTLARTTTGDHGRFVLEAPGPGFWELVARDAERDIALSRTVVAAADEELGTWVAPRHGEVTVEVRDVPGRPLAGARVTVQPRARFAELPGEAITTTTDDRGVATLRATSTSGEVVVWAAGKGASFVHLLSVELRSPEQPIPLRRISAELGREPHFPIGVLEPDGRAAAGAVALVGQVVVARANESGVLELPRLSTPRLHDRIEIRSPSGAVLTPGAVPRPPAPPPPESEQESAQQSETREPSPTPLRLEPPRRVDGVVRDQETGKPVAGALVFGSSDEHHGIHAVAGADGRFEVTVPVAGRSRQLALTARAPGYAQGRSMLRLSEPPDRVATTIELVPGAPIDGVVVDPQSKPVAGAEVSTGGATARTNEKGEFRLPPWARTQGSRLLVAHPDFALLAHELGAGEIGLLRLVLEPGIDAVGWVVDEQGRPVEGAFVWVRPFEGPRAPTFSARSWGRWTATSNAEGRFVLRRLGPGAYTYLVEREGYAPAQVPGLELTVADAGGVAELGTITLSPGHVVRGLVYGPERVPIPGARVTTFGGSALPVFRETTTDAEGRFELVDLPAGAHMPWNVAPPEGWLSVRPVPPLVVPQTAPLEIELVPSQSIAGRVVDAEGRPVANAALRVESFLPERSGRRGFSTATDGTFRIDGLASGVYDLTAEASGYQPATRRGVEVPGPGDAPIVLVLERGAALAGRVTDPNGVPLSEANVRLHDATRQLGQARTDAQGHYRIDGLPLGRVSATPSAGHRSGAVRDVVLEPGENTLDLVVEPHSLFVRGRVLDPGGAPAPHAQVDAWSNGQRRRRARTDEHGAFEIPVEDSGSLVLSARLDRVGGSRKVTVEITDSTIEGIVLHIEPGATVRGRVLGLELDELAQARVQAIPIGLHGYSGAPAPVDLEGRFVLTGLYAGRWEIRADAGAFRGSGRVLASEVVEVELGSEIEVVLDVVERDRFRLTGVVTLAGEPVAGAWVSVSSFSRPGGGNTTTAGDGTFEMTGLAPARYRMQVSALPRPPHRLELDLQRNEHVEIELPLQRLSGRVVDRDSGDPVPWATVQLREQSGEPAFDRRRTLSDAHGRFALEGIAAGSYQLEVSAEGYAIRHLDLALGETDHDVMVELEPGSGVVLLVSQPDQRPPPGVEVTVFDPAGRLLLGRRVSAGEGGRVELRDLPAGTWRLRVQDPPWIAELVVAAPGGPVPVRLELGSGLQISVPELLQSQGHATLELERLDGRALGYGESNTRPLRRGRATYELLLPGTWRARARAGERTFEATVLLEPGAFISVELREPGSG
jgi:protocatechuate 3,4-dioxygenase beta subunit